MRAVTTLKMFLFQLVKFYLSSFYVVFFKGSLWAILENICIRLMCREVKSVILETV